MLAKTGLLILSNPMQIGKILPAIQEQVKNTLYIQLLSALGDSFGNFHSNVFTSWPKYSQTIHGIYSQAATHCRDLDVRVLLSGLKYPTVTQIQTCRTIDLVIFDKKHSKVDVDNFVQNKIKTVSREYQTITIDSGDFVKLEADEPCEGKLYKHTVIGGTFDRLHVAHKLLLSEAVLRSKSAVTVGVTESSMLSSKTLHELIESLEARTETVKQFLSDICWELVYNVVPINDPFGPSIHDSTMDMIVVSPETIPGAQKINQIRVNENKLAPLDVVPIKLIDEPHWNPPEETKISSSNKRMRLLGTLLKPLEPKNIPKQPYVIGLTGGVASGKSGVAKWLELRGVEIVNCDLIGHDVYKRGKPCYEQIIKAFGEGVVGEDGEIDRKVLGGIVFKNPEEMKKLTGAVWPAIGEEVLNIIKTSRSRVVVVEAAVLIMAKWEMFCHEVWTTLVPRNEAIKRLIARNGLSEEQANARIDSQPSNKNFVEASNVVLCPLWDPEVTKRQVDKAWVLLQERIL